VEEETGPILQNIGRQLTVECIEEGQLVSMIERFIQAEPRSDNCVRVIAWLHDYQKTHPPLLSVAIAGARLAQYMQQIVLARDWPDTQKVEKVVHCAVNVMRMAANLREGALELMVAMHPVFICALDVSEGVQDSVLSGSDLVADMLPELCRYIAMLWPEDYHRAHRLEERVENIRATVLPRLMANARQRLCEQIKSVGRHSGNLLGLDNVKALHSAKSIIDRNPHLARAIVADSQRSAKRLLACFGKSRFQQANKEWIDSLVVPYVRHLNTLADLPGMPRSECLLLMHATTLLARAVESLLGNRGKQFTKEQSMRGYRLARAMDGSGEINAENASAAGDMASVYLHACTGSQRIEVATNAADWFEKVIDPIPAVLMLWIKALRLSFRYAEAVQLIERLIPYYEEQRDGWLHRNLLRELASIRLLEIEIQGRESSQYARNAFFSSIRQLVTSDDSDRWHRMLAQSNPACADARRLLARCAVALEDWTEADWQAQAFLDAQPADSRHRDRQSARAKMWRIRGLAAKALGQSAEADYCFRQSLREHWEAEVLLDRLTLNGKSRVLDILIEGVPPGAKLKSPPELTAYLTDFFEDQPSKLIMLLKDQRSGHCWTTPHPLPGWLVAALSPSCRAIEALSQTAWPLNVCQPLPALLTAGGFRLAQHLAVAHYANFGTRAGTKQLLQRIARALLDRQSSSLATALEGTVTMLVESTFRATLESYAKSAQQAISSKKKQVLDEIRDGKRWRDNIQGAHPPGYAYCDGFILEERIDKDLLAYLRPVDDREMADNWQLRQTAGSPETRIRGTTWLETRDVLLRLADFNDERAVLQPLYGASLFGGKLRIGCRDAKIEIDVQMDMPTSSGTWNLLQMRFAEWEKTIPKSVYRSVERRDGEGKSWRFMLGITTTCPPSLERIASLADWVLDRRLGSQSEGEQPKLSPNTKEDVSRLSIDALSNALHQILDQVVWRTRIWLAVRDVTQTKCKGAYVHPRDILHHFNDLAVESERHALAAMFHRLMQYDPTVPQPVNYGLLIVETIRGRRKPEFYGPLVVPFKLMVRAGKEIVSIMLNALLANAESTCARKSGQIELKLGLDRNAARILMATLEIRVAYEAERKPGTGTALIRKLARLHDGSFFDGVDPENHACYRARLELPFFAIDREDGSEESSQDGTAS